MSGIRTGSGYRRDSSRLGSALEQRADPEGGRVVGHDAVRRYWERQWAEIQATVQPTTISERSDGTVEVGVHQVVRNRTGTILAVAEVRHVSAFDGISSTAWTSRRSELSPTS